MDVTPDPGLGTSGGDPVPPGSPDHSALSEPRGAASIELQHVGKRYPDGTVAVHDLSLKIEAGELVVLIGPSGCGKSTILRLINRLIEPTSGRLLLGDEDVTRTDAVRLRRRIGYVIQNVGLFPHQKVRTNVATVPRLLGWPTSRINERVDELLHLVEMEPVQFADRYPHELSGGQQQRVGVARALAADPVVLLMDEPFSAVDPITRTRLQDEFLRLQAEVRKTIVLVTHDLEEAVRLGDRIAVLSQGGRLEQYAPPAALLGAPASPFVREFVGADRGIRQLAVTPIIRQALLPASPRVEGLPTVELGCSAYDALALMLTSRTDQALVTENGVPVGVLTRDQVFAPAHSDG